MAEVVSKYTESPETSGLSQFQLSELLWKEFEYRHTHYWRLVTRIVLATSFILAFPTVYQSTMGKLGDFAILFPFLSLLISTVGAGLIAAEGTNIQWSLVPFIELRNRNVALHGLTASRGPVTSLFPFPISAATPFLVALIGQLLSIAYILALWGLPWPTLVVALIVLLGMFTAINFVAVYRPSRVGS